MTTTGYCDQCGAALTPGAKFCAACGAPAPRADSPPRRPSAPGPDEPLRPSLPAVAQHTTRTQFVLRTVLGQLREHPGTVLKNAFSIRLIFAALLIALIPAALGALIAPALGSVLFFLVFIPVWLLSAANPLTVLYCPYCHKRVKAGADTCHHCGRTVTPA